MASRGGSTPCAWLLVIALAAVTCDARMQGEEVDSCIYMTSDRYMDGYTPMAHMSFSRFQTNFVTTNEDVVVEVRPDVSPVVESTAAHSDPDIAHAAWALQPSKFPNLCFSAQF